MEIIITCFFYLFLFGLLIETFKIFIKVIKNVFMIILIATIISILASNSYTFKNNFEKNNGEICDRIDGCPIVNGICLGCN